MDTAAAMSLKSGLHGTTLRGRTRTGAAPPKSRASLRFRVSAEVSKDSSRLAGGVRAQAAVEAPVEALNIAEDVTQVGASFWSPCKDRSCVPCLCRMHDRHCPKFQLMISFLPSNSRCVSSCFFFLSANVAAADWQHADGVPEQSGGRLRREHCCETGDYGAMLQRQGQVHLEQRKAKEPTEGHLKRKCLEGALE